MSRPKAQGRAIRFRDVEPWPEPVDGPGLLDWIAEEYVRFLALPAGAVEAFTLWTVHAHAHDFFEVSPLLVLKSPAMRCGKTTALIILEHLVPRPQLSCNITAPALFRTIEKFRPTLLIDEADAFIREDEDLRGLLNSGHRRGATVTRLVGNDYEPHEFSTWCPKSIASIGALAATLEDRSVTIPMRRKRDDERVERMRLDRLGSLAIVCRKIARWVQDHEKELRVADPFVPESLDDRAADNWRPLLAIADEAGKGWPKRSRDAAVLLSLGRSEESGPKEQILADTKQVFEQGEMSSADLAEALVKLEDRPWAEWTRGRGRPGLTPNGLAWLLRPYGIKSGNIRAGGVVLKGYKRADFEDAWKRYVADGARPENGSVAAQNAPKATSFPAPGVDCSGVADGNPPGAKGDAWEPEVES